MIVRADGAGLHVGDIFRACLLVRYTPFALPREANAAEALAGGEDDAAIAVVPGVAFVLLHHRELHAVDGDQFFEDELDGLVHR